MRYVSLPGILYLIALSLFFGKLFGLQSVSTANWGLITVVTVALLIVGYLVALFES